MKMNPHKLDASGLALTLKFDRPIVVDTPEGPLKLYLIGLGSNQCRILFDGPMKIRRAKLDSEGCADPIPAQLDLPL